MSEVERMLEIVIKHPMLYDMSHEDYKNIRKKDRLWAEIADEIGNLNYEDLKRKWKNMRDTYAKYLRGSQTKSGQAARKWLWAKRMEPFRPFLSSTHTPSLSHFLEISISSPENSTRTSSLSNFGLEPQCQSQHTPDSVRDTDSNSTIGEAFAASEGNTEAEVEPLLADPESSPGSSQETNFAKKRKINRMATFVQSSAGYDVTHLQKRKLYALDAIDSTFLAHAKTVKTFSPMRQAITKLKIAQLIAEQEIEHVNEVNSNSSLLQSDLPSPHK